MKKILSILSKEGIVIMPCDTIYGIVGVYPLTDTKIRDIKGRGENKPFLILIQKDWIKRFTDISIDKYFLDLWPGPLTLIVPDFKGNTIALRVPDDRRLQEILLKLNKPLFSTSVNKTGFNNLDKAEEIESEFGSLVDLFINEGDLIGSRPSTIIDLSVSPYKLIRQGACKIDSKMLK